MNLAYWTAPLVPTPISLPSPREFYWLMEICFGDTDPYLPECTI